MTNVEIGQNLKIARTKKGLTLEQVAAYIPISKQAVSNWEHGKNRIASDCINKLNELLNINIYSWYAQKERKSMEIKPLKDINDVEELYRIADGLVDSLMMDTVYEKAIKKMVKLALYTVLGYEVYFEPMRTRKMADVLPPDWECVAEDLKGVIDRGDEFPMPADSRFPHSDTHSQMAIKLEWIAFAIGGELFEDFDETGYRNGYIQQVGRRGEESGYILSNILPQFDDVLTSLLKVAIYDLCSILSGEEK